MYFPVLSYGKVTQKQALEKPKRFWRAQIALYLMGRVHLSPLMKVMTTGATENPYIAHFSMLNLEIRVKSELRKYV